jgi:hypothetical protein
LQFDQKKGKEKMKTAVRKALQREVVIRSEETIRMDELIERLTGAVPYENVAMFIALLEKAYENWDLAIELINHFDALKKDYLKGLTPEERDEALKELFKPKRLY